MNDRIMEKSTQKEDEVIIDDCWNHIGIWGTESPRCPKLDKVLHCQNCAVYADTGRKLLDRKLPDGYMNEWTNILTHKKDSTQTSTLSVIIFRVGDEWYALKTQVFNEITEMHPIHSIPHRKNRILKGITNIRGELYLCVSLGFLFEVEQSHIDNEDKKIHHRLVMIEKDSKKYVFPVNEILGVQHFSPDQVKTPPSTISKASTTYITGVIEHSEKHIGCIDDELLILAFSRKLA